MKSQMKAADKENADFALILGDTELEKEIVIVKNMRDGIQQEIAKDNLIYHLKQQLN